MSLSPPKPSPNMSEDRNIQPEKPMRRVLRPAELGEVEMCLESVVVPGELESWTAALQQAVANEGPCLRREILENHPQQLAKVSAADTNMAHHVTQLQQEDAAILEAFDEFEVKVKRLHDRSNLAGNREDKFEQGIKAITEEGLGLVIRIRKQERAISTWFSEAMQRDNGVGD